MLKNTIIILSFCLLISTMSNISLFNVEAQNKLRPVQVSLKQSAGSEFDNGVDYTGQVKEKFVKNALKNSDQAQSEYILTIGNGQPGHLNALEAINLIDDALALGGRYRCFISGAPMNTTGFANFAATAKPPRCGRGGFCADINDPLVGF